MFCNSSDADCWISYKGCVQFISVKNLWCMHVLGGVYSVNMCAVLVSVWVLMRRVRVCSHTAVTLRWFDLLLKRWRRQPTARQDDVWLCNRATWDPTWSPQFGQSIRQSAWGNVGGWFTAAHKPSLSVVDKSCRTRTQYLWFLVEIGAICQQLPSSTIFGTQLTIQQGRRHQKQRCTVTFISVSVLFLDLYQH